MKNMYFFLHVWKAIDHTFFLALSYFRYFFCCQLMNIFLTQFWTVKLLIHKPQPRHRKKKNMFKLLSISKYGKNFKIFALQV